VHQGRAAARHIAADALGVKVVGRKVWMALAPAVPCRLGLGRVLRPQADGRLLTAWVQRLRACLRTIALLVWVDGLARYATALRRVCRPTRPRSGPPASGCPPPGPSAKRR
jgi:hypothetical protein